MELQPHYYPFFPNSLSFAIERIEIFTLARVLAKILRMNDKAVRTLDTSGLLCPEPLMLLHKEIRLVAKGERIRVIATDPSTERDIPKFCTYLGHTLLSHQVGDSEYIYEIEKA